MPQDAGIISVYPTVTAQDSTTGDYVALAEGDVILVEGTANFEQRSWDYLDKNGFVPVFPGATELKVINNTSSKNLLFTVSYGIDG